MSKEIKLQAGQWYRNREGTICYCIGQLKRVENRFMIETANGLVDEYEANGIICKREEDFDDDDENYWKHLDLVEHLPDCDSFDWEPPKPQPAYRPFRNAEEFKPHRDKWIQRSSKHDTEETKPKGCFRVTAYNDHHVWTDQFPESYETMFNDGKKFEDGTPFGVEVTE